MQHSMALSDPDNSILRKDKKQLLASMAFGGAVAAAVLTFSEPRKEESNLSTFY